MRKSLYLLGAAVMAGCAGSGIARLFNPVPYIGTYAGNWNNLTFSTTGSATMDVAADTTAKTASMVLDLNGNVFGGGDPPAVTMNGTYNNAQMTVSATNTLFGNMTFTVDSNGHISGSAPNVPGPNVDSITFNGTITATGANLTYLIALAGGGTANGTLVMTK